ncbi:hypothetical protein NW762_010150 [Fusarium torreyae]|uniref:Uncharacterized protein n=1 Tax=Fusarium torreyae TaxID=1237075 RepID=A0A9W8VAT5_9HYPO|nr:hypothetical protein NW762_010150 [Fusarium torreyae]
MMTPRTSRLPSTVVSNTLELTLDFPLPTATFEFKEFSSDTEDKDPPVDTDPKILALIKPWEELPSKVIEYLAVSVFPTYQAIFVLCNELVIELPEMSDDLFQNQLRTLPEDVNGWPFKVVYNSGPPTGR